MNRRTLFFQNRAKNVRVEWYLMLKIFQLVLILNYALGHFFIQDYCM